MKPSFLKVHQPFVYSFFGGINTKKDNPCYLKENNMQLDSYCDLEKNNVAELLTHSSWLEWVWWFKSESLTWVSQFKLAIISELLQLYSYF